MTDTSASPQTPGERPGEDAQAEVAEDVHDAIWAALGACCDSDEPVEPACEQIAAELWERGYRGPACAALASGDATLLSCGHCGDGFTGDDIADGDIAGVVCTMCAKAGRAADRHDAAELDQLRAMKQRAQALFLAPDEPGARAAARFILGES